MSSLSRDSGVGAVVMHSCPPNVTCSLSSSLVPVISFCLAVCKRFRLCFLVKSSSKVLEVESLISIYSSWSKLRPLESSYDTSSYWIIVPRFRRCVAYIYKYGF